MNTLTWLRKRLIYPATFLLTVVFLMQIAIGQESAAETSIETADGYHLDATIDAPPTTELAEAKRVIILVHGSGAHSMDVDLTQVTKGNRKNLVFKEIGEALAGKGFAVVRYNKRNYQLASDGREDPEFLKSDTVKQFSQNPLKFFVDDVLAAVKFSQSTCPEATIYLLGHSEGTYVSLQAARQSDEIAGVALIGFAEYSTSRLAFEQTVYRPLYDFQELDLNRDYSIDEEELQSESPLAQSLLQSLPLLDRDQDKAISQAEYQAANFANLLVQDIFKPFREQEAKYPRVAEILKSADFKVAFFQGMLDNQTPAYHTMAFDLLLNQLGKADKMKFHYFPGLGHALDKRESYQDLTYDTIDSDALGKLADELSQFFVVDEE